MNNILIIGCGLLGSSLLRRIHKKKIVKKIFIYEKSKSNVSKIKKLRLPGIIIDNLDKGAINYDLIIFCTPMSEYKNLILKINNFITPKTLSESKLEGNNTDIKILDKISSKNELIKLINNQEYIYKDLSIKSIKCTDSEFDDNPEIKAYIQVRDLTKKDRNNVFVFNGWMFSSSPSIAPFDHPVYDIWLINCY